MTQELGTEYSRVDVESLAPILEPFGLTYDSLLGLLRDTSAVLVGGAVTHYLWNHVKDQETAVPGTKSDLDFWVYSPRDSNKGTGYQHHYAFTNFVLNRFTEFFKPLGFTRSRAQHHEYDETKTHYRTKAGIKIEVLWFANEVTGRYFNLVFTDSLPAPMMMKTDIPIGRAMIYYRSILDGHAEDLAVEYDPLVLNDIRSLKLTPPDPHFSNAATMRRVGKYLERYGMTLRTPVVPSEVTVTEATSGQMAVLPFSGVSGPACGFVGACFPVSGSAELRTDRDPFNAATWDAPVNPLAAWDPSPADPFSTTAPFLAPLNHSSFHESGGVPTPVRPHNHSIPPDAPPRVRRSGHADEDFNIGPEHPIFGLNPRFHPTFADKDLSAAKPPAL